MNVIPTTLDELKAAFESQEKEATANEGRAQHKPSVQDVTNDTLKHKKKRLKKDKN